MEPQRIEGTLILDGLLEGRLPPLPGTEQRLRDWVAQTAAAGLHFNLELDGGTFNLLADNRTLRAAPFGAEPEARIAAALGELLKAFPPEDRQKLYSTIRSTEYRRGVEVQTIYVVNAAGEIEPRSRSLEAETVAPVEPLGARRKLRLAALGVGAALLIVLVASALGIIDLPGLIQQGADAIRRLDAEQIAVDLGPFEKYWTVEKKELKTLDGRTRALVLTLKRTAAFPQTDEALARAAAEAKDDLPARLAVEALARGYVRAEVFDEHEGKFAGSEELRVRGLRDEETVKVALPIPRSVRPGRVRLGY